MPQQTYSLVHRNCYVPDFLHYKMKKNKASYDSPNCPEKTYMHKIPFSLIQTWSLITYILEILCSSWKVSGKQITDQANCKVLLRSSVCLSYVVLFLRINANNVSFCFFHLLILTQRSDFSSLMDLKLCVNPQSPALIYCDGYCM